MTISFILDRHSLWRQTAFNKPFKEVGASIGDDSLFKILTVKGVLQRLKLFPRGAD